MKKKSENKLNINYEVLLAITPSDRSFFCTDGNTFHSLEELSDKLSGISNEAFSFHVNQSKNDFASWIYDIIGDVELAENLRKTFDRKKTEALVKKRVTEIKKKLKLL